MSDARGAKVGNGAIGTIPEGPYTVWTDYGGDGWKWQDFGTLAAALSAERHTARWVLTKPVRVVIADAEDAA